MSTTISYKGKDLTTVENTTKTLLTADKWLEENIVLTDVTGGGGGGAWSFLPASAELVASNDETFNLSADTSWDSWTPSTSPGTILAAGSARAACSYTMPNTTNTAIICASIVRTSMVYTGATAKGYLVEKWSGNITFYAPLETDGYATPYANAVSTGSLGRCVYYTSATGTGITTTVSYGAGPTTGATANVSGNIIGYTRPAFGARCNATYFSTGAAAAVDSSATNIYTHYRIWKVDLADHIFYSLFNYPNGLFID